MPQHEFMELWRKRFGKRFDHEEWEEKSQAKEGRRIAKQARTLRGIKAKIFAKDRYKQKAEMKKTANTFEKQKVSDKTTSAVGDEPVPVYLMDQTVTRTADVLTNTLKQKRKQRAGKWDVPLPQVRPIPEDEMLRVIKTGKKHGKKWKRLVNKVCFVGESFTRKPPKLERYIRPVALRWKKANVTHPQLVQTFLCPIVSVKKNPNGQTYTGLGVITKGTVIEVNCSKMGLVTPTGRIIWSKFAQVTNVPENEGCINSVLLI
jgi:ribosome biogenesis protein NSA2